MDARLKSAGIPMKNLQNWESEFRAMMRFKYPNEYKSDLDIDYDPLTGKLTKFDEPENDVQIVSDPLEKDKA